MKLLLEYGANTDTQDNQGKTALLYSSRNGHTNCVKLLLEHKADPNI